MSGQHKTFPLICVSACLRARAHVCVYVCVLRNAFGRSIQFHSDKIKICIIIIVLETFGPGMLICVTKMIFDRVLPLLVCGLFVCFVVVYPLLFSYR